MGHVLVVEDDPVLQEIIWFNLRLAGHRVTTAADGERALAAVWRQLPDVVVLDVMMPNLDGLAVLRELRADIRTAHVRVVVVSARNRETDVWEGFRTGADCYLTKPVRVSALVELVSELAAPDGRGVPHPPHGERHAPLITRS